MYTILLIKFLIVKEVILIQEQSSYVLLMNLLLFRILGSEEILAVSPHLEWRLLIL